MKKTTLLLFFLVSFVGFSQTPLEKIKNYIKENSQQYQLTTNEADDFVIETVTTSETMGLANYLVMQTTSNGIKIDNNYIYFWIKNDQIINSPKGFISNVSSKINTTNPTLSAVEGFKQALTKLNEPTFTTSIIEVDKNKFKLSNGTQTEDPVIGELVFFPKKNGNLVLAWSYEFYTATGNLWKMKIDATNGDLLEKIDLVNRCNFSGHNHVAQTNQKQHNSIAFEEILFKNEQNTAMLTPGTTNYRVIPWNYESPNHSARQLITNPEAAVALAPLAVAASPNGWHNTNTAVGGSAAATRFNYTKGNNVFAYSDFNNDNPTTPTTYTTASTGVYPDLTFDYTYGGNGTSPKTNIRAATTNLFYMNNIMHDLWYQYGFNEANRNFQQSNYGRGGVAADFVSAEAQDSSFLNNQNNTPGATPNAAILNNANFSVGTADGSKPRMQMYIWNQGKKFSSLTVNTGTLTGTSFQVLENSFNEGHTHLPVAPAALTNNLVLYADGTPDTSDACEVATNAAALSGKIAVIRRGTCTFALKVKAAQTAGAIAVIMVNNQAGNIGMAGDDATITIPAIGMTQVDGEALITSMLSGTVSVSLSSPDTYAYADGDFDNGVIAHEYGHGISRRLVGGGSGGLSSAEQPGEGWSDWFWLIMQIKSGDTRNDARGMATYPINEGVTGPGIREFKYSTDMTVNPHTFADVTDQFFLDTEGFEVVSVHGLGSIWCAMLWDLAWNYIEKYGYNANLYNGTTGGNNKVMQLVIDALKLTPANPSLEECRDAIIQADQIRTGGQDFCMIWKTFARRGLGANADSGDRNDIHDQVVDFTEPAPGPNCTLAVNYFENEDMINIYPNPSNGLVNIKINQFSGKVNLKVVDLNGRVVYSLDNTDFNVEKTINLNHLQSGMYIVKIDGNDLSYTKKVILN